VGEPVSYLKTFLNVHSEVLLFFTVREILVLMDLMVLKDQLESQYVKTDTEI
jgi:hypothetical protein